MQKTSIAVITAIFLTAAAPRPARAGVFEAALLGTVVGAVVGLIIHFSKSKEEKDLSEQERQTTSLKKRTQSGTDHEEENLDK